MNPAVEVWNRATHVLAHGLDALPHEAGGQALEPGDRALTSLLRAHGLVMNGGVHHALELLAPSELIDAAEGFAFFGLADVASLFRCAKSDPVLAECTEDTEALANQRYWAMVPDDGHLFACFATIFRERPEQFSPIGGPSADDFRTNFAGHGVPPELEKLRVFEEEEADGQCFSDGFELTADDKGGLKSWSEDPAFLAALMPFAQANGSGSFYALWANGSPPSQMPVVVFGDEGGAYVVAENVRGLLQLLTFDAEPMIDGDGVTFYKDQDDEDREQSAMHDEYAAWLHKSFGLRVIDDAEAIIEAATQKHGATFETWMKQYYSG